MQPTFLFCRAIENVVRYTQLNILFWELTLLLFEENLNYCSECESVSAVTDSTKYGSVVGSFVSKNPTVELEQLTTAV